MFGSLLRQLRKTVEEQKDAEDSARRRDRALRALRNKVDPDQFDAFLTSSSTPTPRIPDNPAELLSHIEEQGFEAVRALTETAASKASFEQSWSNKTKSREDFWAASPPPISDAQRDVLKGLPSGVIRETFLNELRTGVIYDIELRPATKADRSFVGGLPIVGEGMVWPTDKKGNPLEFIAQIAMEDLPDFPARAHFPEAGALVFFFSHEEGEHPSHVQHVSLQDAREIAAPSGLSSYISHFGNKAFDAEPSQLGWRHELGHDVPLRAIRPKWPLCPRVAAIAPKQVTDETLALDVPPELLASYKDSLEVFIDSTHAALNDQSEVKYPSMTGPFDGFPQTWDAIGDLAQRFLDIVDACEADERVEFPDAAHDLRALLKEWLGLSQRVQPGTPTSQEDRDRFQDVLRLISSESGIALPVKNMLPGTPDTRNTQHIVDEIITRVQLYSALSSMCSDMSGWSQAAQEQAKSYFRDMHACHSRQDPIQSLGHGTSFQGSEAPLYSILLFQIPSSLIGDWRFGDADTLQYWMSHEDFVAQQYSEASHELGR